MDQMTTNEWWAKAEELLGEKFTPESAQRITFVCPMCGHVAAVKEFPGDNLADKFMVAAQNCLGRFNKSMPCDWAAYGLFRTCGKGVLVDPQDGREPIEVFQLGEPLPKESGDGGS